MNSKGGNRKPLGWRCQTRHIGAPAPPRWSTTPIPGEAVHGDVPPRGTVHGDIPPRGTVWKVGAAFQQSSLEVHPGLATGREVTLTTAPLSSVTRRAPRLCGPPTCHLSHEKHSSHIPTEGQSVKTPDWSSKASKTQKRGRLRNCLSPEDPERRDNQLPRGSRTGPWAETGNLDTGQRSRCLPRHRTASGTGTSRWGASCHL